jgi:hypothetical protein
MSRGSPGLKHRNIPAVSQKPKEAPGYSDVQVTGDAVVSACKRWPVVPDWFTEGWELSRKYCGVPFITAEHREVTAPSHPRKITGGVLPEPGGVWWWTPAQTMPMSHKRGSSALRPSLAGPTCCVQPGMLIVRAQKPRNTV